MNQIIGMRLRSAISRKRDTLTSPVCPMLVVAVISHLRAVNADLEPFAVVEQAVHPLARRPLAALVLLTDFVLAAHLLDLGAALFEVFYAVTHLHRQWILIA
jgi:hypothetical protein